MDCKPQNLGNILYVFAVWYFSKEKYVLRRLLAQPRKAKKSEKRVNAKG